MNAFSFGATISSNNAQNKQNIRGSYLTADIIWRHSNNGIKTFSSGISLLYFLSFSRLVRECNCKCNSHNHTHCQKQQNAHSSANHEKPLATFNRLVRNLCGGVCRFTKARRQRGKGIVATVKCVVVEWANAKTTKPTTSSTTRCRSHNF